MTTDSTDQRQIYDGIAEQYDAVWTIPASAIVVKQFNEIIQDRLDSIKGGKVLELACGTGYFLRSVRDLAAPIHVFGADISSDMISKAIAIDRAVLQDGAEAIEFVVGDCAEPLENLAGQEQTFDLVMANFLFNYAKTEEEMQRMWNNVANYLKPGGLFVGLTQTLDDIPDHTGKTGKYGMKVKLLETNAGCDKQHMTFLTEPKVEFETYVIRDQGVWERTAAIAGLEGLKFETYEAKHIPTDMQDAKGSTLLEYGYWRDLLDKPWNPIMTATKKTMTKYMSSFYPSCSPSPRSWPTLHWALQIARHPSSVEASQHVSFNHVARENDDILSLLWLHFFVIYEALPRHAVCIEAQISRLTLSQSDHSEQDDSRLDVSETFRRILIRPSLIAHRLLSLLVRESPIGSSAFPFAQRGLIGHLLQSKALLDEGLRNVVCCYNSKSQPH